MLTRFLMRFVDWLVPPRRYACLTCNVRGVQLRAMLLHSAETGHAYERIPPDLS